MKIGVLSDTHIPGEAKTLPGIIFEAFQGVTHIIHAGDIGGPGVLETLKAIAPVTAVAGNVDTLFLKDLLGEKVILEMGGIRIGVFHGHEEKGKTMQRAARCFRDDAVDCICFGHSHQPYCGYCGDILLFNPGSPTNKRREAFFSVGILEIGQAISPHIIYFDPAGIIRIIR